jgi:arylsulfatase A-like enzyme
MVILHDSPGRWSFLTAISSWMIIMCVDYVALGLFTSQQKFPPFQIFPGITMGVIILGVYMGAGVVTALLAFSLQLATKKIPVLRIWLSEKFPLVLTLIISSFINIFVLVKSQRVPLLKTWPHPVILMALITAIILVLFLGAVSIRKLKKRLLVSVPAACIAVELFWCFIRGSFLKGGIFLDFTRGLHVTVVFFVILLFCCTVFILLYWLVPKALARAGLCLAVVSCLVCFTAGNVRLYAAEGADSVKKTNIVLIILDTLRADHLSCYGYHKKTTPNIDRFASDAVKYTKAYSTASWTLPSTASIMTGKYPGSHGAHRNKSGHINPFNILDDRQVTLAEILQGSGYATAGIVSCQFFTRQYGMHQGFDFFDDTMPSNLFIMPTFSLLPFLNYFLPINDYFGSRGLDEHRAASQINRAARAWLKNNTTRKPFFLLLHYFDVHHPYYPEKLGTSENSVPPAIMKKYGRNSANYAEMEKHLIASVQDGTKPLLDHERKYLVDNYDREITLLDKKVGKMLDVLKDQGLYDDSLIIITADHGESFGEHNLMLHGIGLYEDNLHVPLLVKYPSGNTPAGTQEHPVSLTGIMPTVLSYLSIPVPRGVQGAPFDDREGQTILAQNYTSTNVKGQQQFRSDMVSLQQDDYKYIRFAQAQDQLFNLREDPAELHNIMDAVGVPAETMQQTLNSFMEQSSLSGTEDEGEKVEMDKATLENLKSLGYLD